MKRKYIPCLLILGFSTIASASTDKNDSCNTETSGRSYLQSRPLFQSTDQIINSGFRSERTYACEDGYNGAIKFAVFGSKSTNSDHLNQYFTPFGKTSLIVDSETNPSTESDLLAAHFNIFTQNEFRSEISFAPEQSMIGLGIHYRQGFWRCDEKERGFWFSISSPITRVKNNMNLDENIINDGGEINENADTPGTVQANMTEAFSQEQWEFGKIDTASRSETKLADIEVKIGYEWLQQDPYHLESYIGLLIPTGDTPDGKFVFDSIVGNGHHLGIMFGSAGGFRLWQDEENDRSLRVEYGTHSQYLFKKTQKRSFDLKGRPWSRYQEVYADVEQAQEAAALDDGLMGVNLATPGINVFTQNVDVTPGFQYNINTALVYTSCGFQGEAGYNFFSRRSDCVQLSSQWQEGPALKAADGFGTTNPVRDITGNNLLEMISVDLADYERSIIKEEDFDFTSAAHPCMLSHTVYGSLGYRWDEREYPAFVNAGASYEFSNSNNAVIERWAIWGKLGFSF